MAEATTITVHCPQCHENGEYAPSGMRVTLLRGLDCYYEFFCYRCHGYTKTPVDAQLAVVLHDAGVNVRVIEPPAEVRSWPKDAPKLTEQDLVRFQGSLEEL